MFAIEKFIRLDSILYRKLKQASFVDRGGQKNPGLRKTKPDFCFGYRPVLILINNRIFNCV